MELLSSFVVPLSDELPVNAHKFARSSTLRVLHEAMFRLLATLILASASKVSAVLSRTRCHCHFTVVSYCYNTPEGKDIFGLKHGGTAHPCIWCLIKKERISSLKTKQGG